MHHYEHCTETIDPVKTDDNFDQDDFGATGETLEELEDIMEGGFVDGDLRNLDAI